MKLTYWSLTLALAVYACGPASAQDTGTSVPEAAPVQTVSAAPRVIRISGGVAAGNILTKVQPVYPPEAKAQGVSGRVVLHAIIGRDGTVQELSVVAGNELLQRAAMDAVRQWTYRPYLLNGNPVAVDTVINVNFNLAGPASAPLTSATPVTQTMTNGDTETIKVVNQTAAGPATGPVRVSGGVIAGNILTKVMPVYPEEARCKHVGGGVVVHVIIGKDGRVISADPVSGPDLLRKPYADAIKQWTYRPFLLDGQPVEVDTTVSLIIDMNGDGCKPDTPRP